MCASACVCTHRLYGFCVRFVSMYIGSHIVQLVQLDAGVKCECVPVCGVCAGGRHGFKPKKIKIYRKCEFNPKTKTVIQFKIL